MFVTLLSIPVHTYLAKTFYSTFFMLFGTIKTVGLRCASVAPSFHQVPDRTHGGNAEKEPIRNLLMPSLTYRETLSTTGLPTQEQGKIELCHRFSFSLQANPHVSDLLLLRTAPCHGHSLWSRHKLTVMPHGTRRFLASPVSYLTSLITE